MPKQKGIIIIDELYGQDTAHLEAFHKHFDETIKRRLDNPTTPVTVIFSRVTPEDKNHV